MFYCATQPEGDSCQVPSIWAPLYHPSQDGHSNDTIHEECGVASSSTWSRTEYWVKDHLVIARTKCPSLSRPGQLWSWFRNCFYWPAVDRGLWPIAGPTGPPWPFMLPDDTSL